jgi:hypothetical protein
VAGKAAQPPCLFLQHVPFDPASLSAVQCSLSHCVVSHPHRSLRDLLVTRDFVPGVYTASNPNRTYDDATRSIKLRCNYVNLTEVELGWVWGPHEHS